MIKQIGSSFYLDNGFSSMLISIDKINKPVLSYYGAHIDCPIDEKGLLEIIPFAAGNSIIHDEKTAPALSLDNLCLELSTPYKGDFGDPSILIEGTSSPVYDFIYKSFKFSEPTVIEGLPTPHGAKEELILFLEDSLQHVEAELHYVIYEGKAVFGRYLKITNKGDEKISLRKAASMQLVLNDVGFEMISFYGGWANELQKEVTPIGHLRYSFDSTSGSSSARHNPFFIIRKKGGSYSQGDCYGFNLVYSGNHFEEAEMSSFGKIRIQNGISPLGFKVDLGKDESFSTPMAILSFSGEGLNGLTKVDHDFVSEHIIRSEYTKKSRPVAYNNWEGTGMKFTEPKLHSLIKKASALGVELFVLDDGWFGSRNDDTSSLGDWFVNKKKLPHGLEGLSKYIHKHNMEFGLWFEPEMVSPDSDLYRSHPDWAIKDGLHEASLGRHQLTLDLSKKDVRDYLFSSLSKILSSTKIEYVKWDYNRQMSDLPRIGFAYEYMLGLYSLLRRLTKAFPSILFENCASGGNRFDLGMLSYFPQSWISDDTDCYQRAKMGEGLSLGYPLSVQSNHVSSLTNSQTVRKTSIGNKFDVACFGVLGYEMDLADLGKFDYEEVKREISFYKAHRELFQFGDYLTQSSIYEGMGVRQVSKGDEAAVVKTAGITSLLNPVQTLTLLQADPKANYHYEVREEYLDLKKFGPLVNYVSPIHLKEDGWLLAFLSHHQQMGIEKACGKASGSALANGAIKLPPLWGATGYNEEVCLIGDFGSRLYILRKSK